LQRFTTLGKRAAVPSKYYDWLSAQIEQHAKIQVAKQVYDHTALTRLADAAGALRNRPPGAQAFGMTLPAEGIEGSEALVDRCLAIIEERAPLLDDPDVRDNLGALLQRYGLKPVIPAPVPPQITHRLHVNLPVVVEAAGSEEEIHDESTLRGLDGTRADAISLVDVACVHDAVGHHLDPVKKSTGWANDGFARLVFDDHLRALRCQLVFSLVREPAPPELERLLQCIRTELSDSSWIANLEWDPPQGAPEVIVHIQHRVVSHEMSPV
jgi:hypothetical protein